MAEWVILLGWYLWAPYSRLALAQTRRSVVNILFVLVSCSLLVVLTFTVAQDNLFLSNADYLWLGLLGFVVVFLDQVLRLLWFLLRLIFQSLFLFMDLKYIFPLWIRYHPRQKTQREGALLLDALVGVTVLLVLALPLGSHTVAQQRNRRLAQAKAEANWLAQNTMELLRATPFERLGEWHHREEIVSPGHGQMRQRVFVVERDRDLREVEVRLSWESPWKQEQTVTLRTLLFRRGIAQ